MDNDNTNPPIKPPPDRSCPLKSSKRDKIARSGQTTLKLPRISASFTFTSLRENC